MDRRDLVLGGRRLRLVAVDAPTAEAALTFVTARLADDPRPGERRDAGPERVQVAGHDAWFKQSGLRGGARLRWTLRAWAGGRVPREREYAHLTWLRARLFEAPLPLAAGRLDSAGAPCWQFLLTRHEPGAVRLDASLESARDVRDVLAELGRETARLHALGFRHGDLYARNVLVRPVGTARRVVFLDAWAGGPPPHLRPLLRDVEDFLRDIADALDDDSARAFVAAYAAGRAAQGRPVDPRALADVVRRAREP